MRSLHTVVVGAIAVGVAVLAAGCGGAIPPTDGGPATVDLKGPANARVLVDAQGRSLYLFAKDERNESYCNGACAAVWPPLETSAKPRAGGGVAAGALGTIERSDGDRQVTYHGEPLYYYAADASTPGKTKGEDIEQFGAGWYLVDSRGKPFEPEQGSKPKSSSSSGSSGAGGGYG